MRTVTAAAVSVLIIGAATALAIYLVAATIVSTALTIISITTL